MNLVKKNRLHVLLASAGLVICTQVSAQSNDFINGGFESGTTTGWSAGGGTFSTPLANGAILDPASYTSGTPVNSIVSSGNDPILHAAGVDINMVYAGNYAVRVNDSNNNKSISTIAQTVTNYSGTSINFAWFAVLEGASHTANDAGNFTVKVVDNTTNTTLTSISYNSAAPGGFLTYNNSAGVWYSGWQTVAVNVTAGNTYTVSLLAADCDAGGHFGYVYLDGFGVVAPVQSSGIPDIVSSNNGQGGFNKLSTVSDGTYTNRFDGGTVKVDSNNASTSAAFTISANKGFIDQDGNIATFSGRITDDGADIGRLIIKNGDGSVRSGKIVLADATNSYSGGTEVQAGATLSIANPGALGTGGLDLVGSSTVPAVLETTASMTISAPITVSGDPVFSVAPSTTTTITSPITDGASAGDVVVAGGGTLELTAVNTYTGPTSITETSTLVLSGVGSIATSSALNNTNGTFDITGANGNVSLGGTYTQASAGNLSMNISPTNNQKLLVTGAASLAGGLNLVASSGNYLVGRYTLITGNGVSGTFDTFTNNLASYTRLGYQLGYDANNVYLYLTPNVSDTQASLQYSSNALQGTFTLQNSVLVNGFTYDCPVFDKNGICLSVGGRNTTVQAQGINNTSGLLIASYQLDKDYSRIGAYIDQNLSVSGPGTVRMDNSTPMIGVFGVWAENLDTTGWGARISAAYGQKSTTVTRQVVNTSEPGSGTANLNTQGVQLTGKYGFAVADNVIVSPYVGMRYTQNNMGGYTESASANVTSPLTYAPLNTNATTALAGAEAKYRFDPKTTVFASAGVETDTNTKNGTYSATGFGLTTLTPINFNPNPVKTRPTATVGGYYDIEKAQRLGVTGIWRQEPFQAVSTTTVMATYTIGL